MCERLEEEDTHGVLPLAWNAYRIAAEAHPAGDGATGTPSRKSLRTSARGRAVLVKKRNIHHITRRRGEEEGTQKTHARLTRLLLHAFLEHEKNVAYIS